MNLIANLTQPYQRSASIGKGRITQAIADVVFSEPLTNIEGPQFNWVPLGGEYDAIRPVTLTASNASEGRLLFSGTTMNAATISRVPLADDVIIDIAEQVIQILTERGHI